MCIRDRTNAQELVQDKHVSFLAPVLSDVASGATGTYLAQQKVPFIGWATDAAFATDPQWGFSIDGNQTNPNIQDITVADTLAITGFKKPSQIKEAYIGENIAGAIVSNNALAEASKDCLLYTSRNHSNWGEARRPNPRSRSGIDLSGE